MAPVCPVMTPKFSQSPYTFHNTVEQNRDQECNNHLGEIKQRKGHKFETRGKVLDILLRDSHIWRSNDAEASVVPFGLNFAEFISPCRPRDTYESDEREQRERYYEGNS